MSIHLLERRIDLPISPERVWTFIATPRNLNQLTPPELNFRIVSPVPELMYDGLIIRYAISIPLFGTHDWLTEIKHIQPGRSFVDEQRCGPYRLWYHKLEPLPDGQCRMLDRVHYQLPFGPLGDLVHRYRVEPMLQRIFDFRAAKLTELFAGPSS